MFSRVTWVDVIPGDDDLLAAAAKAVSIPPEGGFDAVLNSFRRDLERPAVRIALTPPEDEPRPEVWREHDFAEMVGQDLMRGAFDRVVIWRDGEGKPIRAELIDYKTDPVLDEESLARATAIYAPQLWAYRQALSTMLGLDESRVRASLLFVGDGVRWDLPLGVDS
jgi:ATP-dependent exoDNAse (exonuclease V) beta subunit